MEPPTVFPGEELAYTAQVGSSTLPARVVPMSGEAHNPFDPTVGAEDRLGVEVETAHAWTCFGHVLIVALPQFILLL